MARRHAACVNIAPVHRSIYRWQGKICEDSEYMLLIKTMDEEYPAVEKAVRELHNYELPEILAFEVQHGDARFLSWIAESLDKEAGFPEEAEAAEESGS